MNQFSIRIEKQYLNFAASHFMIFADGTREPLHGHNYRVKVQGDGIDLNSDMLFDFLDIKPLVRKICDQLDHKFLLPGDNKDLKWEQKNGQINLICPDQDQFSFPEKDVLVLPITNVSAERLAQYLNIRINEELKTSYSFTFNCLTVEVEETPGQSAIYKFEA